VLGTFAVANGPFGVAFDGANIWVASNRGTTVTKLRASDGTLLGTFPGGSSPLKVAFDGADIWVTSGNNGGDRDLHAGDHWVMSLEHGHGIAYSLLGRKTKGEFRRLYCSSSPESTSL
jgi:hypothetical protein